MLPSPPWLARIKEGGTRTLPPARRLTGLSGLGGPILRGAQYASGTWSSHSSGSPSSRKLSGAPARSQARRNSTM